MPRWFEGTPQNCTASLVVDIFLRCKVLLRVGSVTLYDSRPRRTSVKEVLQPFSVIPLWRQRQRADRMQYSCVHTYLFVIKDPSMCLCRMRKHVSAVTGHSFISINISSCITSSSIRYPFWLRCRSPPSAAQTTLCDSQKFINNPLAWHY